MVAPARSPPPPDTFSFVADTRDHRGRSGITMGWAPAISTTPSFTCSIDGNEIDIGAQGTLDIRIDFDKEGLGIEGEVVVRLNGTERYRGPVKNLELDVGTP